MGILKRAISADASAISMVLDVTDIVGEIEKIHSDNFKDKGPIFYTADPLDREDAFYLYENGHLFRQHGYYIYYDRNEAMQNYMFEIRQDNQEMREGTPGFQNRLYEKKTDHHNRHYRPTKDKPIVMFLHDILHV